MSEILWFSNNEAFILIIISLIVIFFLNRFLFSKNKNLPPGPFCLPIVGYFPFMTKTPHLKFLELGKVYGNIFSLRIGSQLAVVLNDGRAIREAFSKPEFLGREALLILSVNNTESPFFLNGKVWSEHRRFALHALRDLGLGKSIMQDHIQDEIKYILQRIEEKSAKPFPIKPLLVPSMSNIITSLVFGKRYEYDDPERMFLDSLLKRGRKFLTQASLFVFFPWMAALFYKILFNMEEMSKISQELIAHYQKKIKEHKETLDENNMRDFIDHYLVEQKIRNEKDPETTFNVNHYLPGTAQTLFGAGSNTVRTSVEWVLYTLAAYPDVQKRVQLEIEKVVGSERLPEVSDQKSMPYTQAVLQEVQRWKTIVPLNLLRKTLDDVEVFGYHIPKNTLVFANLWGAHHDPKCWENPDEFNPERFLSTDQKTVLKTENFMPFSYGKRSCPGEGLAVLEVFLYVTSILQTFSIQVPESSFANLEAEFGLTYEPKLHELLFIKNKH